MFDLKWDDIERCYVRQAFQKYFPTFDLLNFSDAKCIEILNKSEISPLVVGDFDDEKMSWDEEPEQANVAPLTKQMQQCLVSPQGDRVTTCSRLQEPSPNLLLPAISPQAEAPLHSFQADPIRQTLAAVKQQPEAAITQILETSLSTSQEYAMNKMHESFHISVTLLQQLESAISTLSTCLEEVSIAVPAFTPLSKELEDSMYHFLSKFPTLEQVSYSTVLKLPNPPIIPNISDPTEDYLMSLDHLFNGGEAEETSFFEKEDVQKLKSRRNKPSFSSTQRAPTLHHHQHEPIYQGPIPRIKQRCGFQQQRKPGTFKLHSSNKQTFRETTAKLPFLLPFPKQFVIPEWQKPIIFAARLNALFSILF